MTKRTRAAIGASRGSGTLGTFGGVFTPSILTILGIILFRRLGYVVGSAGLGRALVVIAMANALSILTTISLCAIATNLRIKGGGVYYIISRTLGVEFGGALGIILFLAQSVSIAFYCIGFGEVLTELLPGSGPATAQIVAGLAVLLLFLFAWLGADWATRFQYVVMVVLAAALASFFVGGIRAGSGDLMTINLGATAQEIGFWMVFAIFFPAVTGFTQGVSMSGDLREPGKSIVWGTLTAVIISCIIYFAAAFVFAAGLPASDLATDYNAIRRLAAVGWLIIPGVLAATISSAMASFLGAPRILQALAADRIFPFLRGFAAGHGPTRNPRRGVLLSLGIASATIALGNLNVIAPVVSMFFLASYGLLNYATYFEARAASPSFRPRFRWFDRRLSLLGALGCLGAMLAINPTASAISFSLLFAIHQYLKRMAGPARWADGSRSFSFQQVRDHLHSMDASVQHPRDWRPQILAFSRDAWRREQILRFASWIEGGSGITTAVTILEGHRGELRQLITQTQDELRIEITRHGLSAFPLTIAAPDLRSAFEILLQSYGLGPIRANIVLLNWLEQVPELPDPTAEKRYGKYLREAMRLGCSLVVLEAEEEEWKKLESTPPSERRIDVWWWNDPTSHLMLLLAHLMKRTEEWDAATIRVIAVRTKKTERALEELRRDLDEMRIEAEAEVVSKAGAELVIEQSSDADLVFLPLRLKGTQPLDPFGERPELLVSRLPTVALVAAGQDIELAAEPDEGRQAEIAQAVALAQEIEKEARKAKREAAKAEKIALQAAAKLEETTAGGNLDDGARSLRETLEREAGEAQAKAKKLAERAERARAKLERATEDIVSMGATLPGAPLIRRDSNKEG